MVPANLITVSPGRGVAGVTIGFSGRGRDSGNHRQLQNLALNEPLLRRTQHLATVHNELPLWVLVLLRPWRTLIVRWLWLESGVGTDTTLVGRYRSVPSISSVAAFGLRAHARHAFALGLAASFDAAGVRAV